MFCVVFYTSSVVGQSVALVIGLFILAILYQERYPASTSQIKKEPLRALVETFHLEIYHVALTEVNSLTAGLEMKCPKLVLRLAQALLFRQGLFKI